jgi:hypothetical protein
MLAEDVFESRTTPKQEQNADGENNEDITNMDTPTVVAYNSKVKLFFSIIIFNTCGESIGSTWISSPIQVFYNPSFPCMIHTFFDPCKYFCK